MLLAIQYTRLENGLYKYLVNVANYCEIKYIFSCLAKLFKS